MFTGGPTPTNRPRQRSQPRPPRAASTSLPARSDTAAPRAPDRVRPTAPCGRHARLAGATTSPPLLWTALAPPPLSPPPRARSLALSHALSPSLRAHRTASFHLSELRICLCVLGQAFFPQVSLPRGPNRSPESARPRWSSPRCRYP